MRAFFLEQPVVPNGSFISRISAAQLTPSISIKTGMCWYFFYQDNSHESISYDFPQAANPGNKSNHVLVIGKGSRKAIFLKTKPLVSAEALNPSYGDFRFFADGTVLAIDNVRVWNIADIPAP